MSSMTSRDAASSSIGGATALPPCAVPGALNESSACAYYTHARLQHLQHRASVYRSRVLFHGCRSSAVAEAGLAKLHRHGRQAAETGRYSGIEPPATKACVFQPNKQLPLKQAAHKQRH